MSATDPEALLHVMKEELALARSQRDSLSRDLNAANQRIAELKEQSTARFKSAGRYYKAAEAAEAKLATVTAIAIKAIANLSHADRCPTGQSGNSDQCVCGIKDMSEALAQIEQPQKLNKPLPLAKDLTGSDPDFTGNLSTDEYIRSVRGSAGLSDTDELE